jgi:HSP20 family protein
MMFFATSSLGRPARYGYGAFAANLPASADKSVRVDSDDTSVTLSLDVPGLAKDQLTIAIEADVVRIESKADAPRSFKAAYQLASDIDAASSQAKLEHGVLTLKLSKVVPVSRETELAIH